MNVIFMGTPDFAVPCLRALVKKHTVTAVVTQPDKPKGRGNHVLFSPVKEAALELSIEVLQPKKIKSPKSIEKLLEFNADIYIVAAYGQILSEQVLKIPKFGCLNVHGSLLPRHRGAAPIQHAILLGDTKTGITIMQMDKGIDTGDMLFKKELTIEASDNAGTLHDKLCMLGAEALTEALELLQEGKLIPEKQNEALATYSPMLTKEMSRIDWNKTPFEILNAIRAFNPWPVAYTSYKNEILKIYGAKAEELFEYSKPGEIVSLDKDNITVACKNGAVVITEIQAIGRKKMSAADYLRGSHLEKGIIL